MPIHDPIKEQKKASAHKHATLAFYSYAPASKNPYEFGTEEWFYWASRYGTLCHKEKADGHRIPPVTAQQDISEINREQREYRQSLQEAYRLRGCGKLSPAKESKPLQKKEKG